MSCPYKGKRRDGESVEFAGNRYNGSMADSPKQHMQCMEVWGGSQVTSSGVELAGLDVWVYSKPFGEAQRGGDVYYVSSCASGRISRLLLADVSGHGNPWLPRRPTCAR